MSKVVTFGEIMLRLAPEGYYRIVQAENMLPLMAAARQTYLFPWQITVWIPSS